MALTPFALQLLAPHLRGDVLAFGYPDLLMTPSRAGAILGVTLTKTTTHGTSHKLPTHLADTDEAFRACGATWRCVDIAPSRGMEEMFDLNEPHYFGSLFDLVIDAGTIEHCANIGQALMNAANAVWPGGYVFHSPPLAMMNHGFYNVSPTLLADFYQQNGWRVAHLSAFKVAPPYDDVPIDPTGRFPAVNGTALYFLAQRLTAGVLRWPTQTRYQAKAAA